MEKFAPTPASGGQHDPRSRISKAALRQKLPVASCRGGGRGSIGRRVEATRHGVCQALLAYYSTSNATVDGVDDTHSTASNVPECCDRLLEGDIAAKFLTAVLAQPKAKKLLSNDHFSVDGTLIEAWASMKSVKPKDGSGEPPAQGGGRNAEADFHGQKRSNDTHASTTDPDARLYRKGKGKETKLCFIGHGLMENRHGLLVDACLTLADGHAERVAALHMIEPRADRPTAITLGADKAYDAEDFVNELRSMNVTPHVAQNTSGRSSAIDGRTTRHGGYAVSQRIRKRIEEAFGWIKTIAGQEKSRFRGRDRVGWAFTFAAAAYNLVRLPKLIAEAG